MAIKIQRTTQFGIELPEAFIKLHKLNTNRNRINMEFKVYKDQVAYEEGKPHIEFIHKELSQGRPAEEVVLDEEGNVIKEAVPEVVGMESWFSIDLLDGETNPYRQAYLYLMSLEEFSDGIEA